MSDIWIPPPKGVDARLFDLVNARLEGDPVAFCVGFTAGMRMSLKFPEWVQAYLALTMAPDEGDEEQILNALPLHLHDAEESSDERP